MKFLYLSLMLAAGAALSDPIGECQRAMALRPMPPVTDVATGGLYAYLIQADQQRRAALALCLTDPYAHLKPLPWERGAPQPQPICFAQPGGVMVCP